MNRRKDETKTIVGVAALMVLALLLVGPGTAGVMETVTLSGQVEAADHDDDGEVTQVAIYDGEWGLVLVLESDQGNELLKHVGAVVYATGEIRESDDDEYQYAIEVESYTIEEPEDDPDPYPCN